MGRPPVIPPEKKVRVVLAVLAGGVSVSEAARKEKVGEQSVHRWKADFVVAGKVGLIAGRLLRISLPFLIVADDRRGGGARQQHRRGGVGRVADCWFSAGLRCVSRVARRGRIRYSTTARLSSADPTPRLRCTQP
jgi:hypothetical protein